MAMLISDQAIEEIADLGRLPDEWALDFRDRNLAAVDPCEQGLNRMWCDCVSLRGHCVPEFLEY